MTVLEFKTDPSRLAGDAIKARADEFGAIDYRDHQVSFYVAEAEGRDVLDLGCVGHDPDNHRSRYWLHGALRERARSVLGVDLYEDGVRALQAKGFNIVVGDVQVLRLSRQFDVVAAGNLIAHLEDLHGFVSSCKAHMKPDGKLLITTPNPWYWRTVVRAAALEEACANTEQTNWLCPRTMRQLLERHGLIIRKMAFGSRYLRDRLMPLPRGWKHTSIHFLITRVQALLISLLFGGDLIAIALAF